jgi:hypothetical protein
MRLTLAIALLAAAFCLDGPAWAHGRGPWCAVVSAGPAELEWDCEYGSIEECRPNVIAGNRGFCIPNPRWPDAKTAKTTAKFHRKRRIRPH